MADGLTTRRGVMLGTALAAAQAGIVQAGAAQAQGMPAQNTTATPIARANAGTVGVISGGVEGTYIRIAADLASVLDDGDRLRVLPVIGKGSVQNLSDIIYLRGIDIGIVQSDALTYALRENLFPGVSQAIRYIAKLYDEEIHVLARSDITRIEDLAGKKVNVDVKGSGTAMTAAVVFGKLNVAIDPVNDPQDTALQRLQSGDIAALIYVTGKPARLFSSIPSGSNLHFLALPPTAELLDTYLPTQLGHDVYPALVPDGPPVDTLAVGAVMAVYGWQAGSDRYRKVANFIASLNDKFAQFQKPPRHPKWREVNLSAQVPGWSKFAAAPEPAAAPSPGTGRARRPAAPT